MRTSKQILTAALMLGAALAQTAPASQQSPSSQPVKQNPPQQSKVQSSFEALKKALTSPFAPKAKNAQAATQNTPKPQATTKPIPPAPASQKIAPPVQAKTTAPKAAPVQTKANNTKAAPVQAKVAPKKNEPAQAKAVVKPTSPEKPALVPAVAKIVPAETKKPEPPAPVAQNIPVKLPSPGKRDPFLSPLAVAASRGPGGNCSGNKLRCLAVDQVILKGIVQMRGGNFAVVENEARRTLLLHENDSLFNGSVVKITGDSVIFKEESSDVLGRPVSKEVIKKVSAPAV